MNGTRLLMSLLLLALPAAALPAVRRTRRPKAWSFVLALSLGAGFILVEASLIHAALPLGFTMLGLDEFAEACRALGGHLFGGAPPFNALAGLTAAMVGVGAMRGAVQAVRANLDLRSGMSSGPSAVISGHRAVLLPLRQRLALALPDGQVLLSRSLLEILDHEELDAVMRHEVAHLEHHHVRFLLLGATVNAGLWFLPWRSRATTALRLALERWADESASARSGETRTHVRSALRKLASMAPSALAGYRISALEVSDESLPRREWGWPTAVSATVPLVVGLGVTLVIHLRQVIAVAGGG